MTAFFRQHCSYLVHAGSGAARECGVPKVYDLPDVELMSNHARSKRFDDVN
jgi:hypothetical protein